MFKNYNGIPNNIHNDRKHSSISFIGLYGVMVKSHCHVGCNKKEIHTQKSEYVMFQDTGKVNVNIASFIIFRGFLFVAFCEDSSENLFWGTILHIFYEVKTHWNLG